MKNKKGIYWPGIILILILILLFALTITLIIPSIKEYTEFCESHGGAYRDASSCLIKENNAYVEYKIRRVDGRLVLVK